MSIITSIIKLKLNMKYILIVIALNFTCLFGQENPIKNRWNFKFGYSRYVTGAKLSDGSDLGYKKDKTGNLRIEGNYGVFNNFEFGIYMGISNNKWLGYIEKKEGFIPYFGVNFNYHILPLISKRNNFPVDFYITGKYGGLYINSTLTNLSGHHEEYGLGIGAYYYFWKNIGVYSEFSLGKYYYSNESHPYEFPTPIVRDNHKLRIGLVYKM